MISSNTSLGVLQDQVRQNALRSFEFFANSVLSSNLPEDLCAAVQDLLTDREDVTIFSQRPRSLALAVQGWLSSQGVAVLTTIQLPRTEILQWLSLDSVPQGSEACSLDVRKDGVLIQWL